MRLRCCADFTVVILYGEISLFYNYNSYYINYDIKIYKIIIS